MTKYWLDTEFIEDGKTIDLISIGIVCEDGREFYALNYDCDHTKASDWVKNNALNHLPEKKRPNIASSSEDLLGKYASHKRIALEVLEFFYETDNSPEPMPTPEIWAYYADYDWVAFCQLFGAMMDLPGCFPMYCRDIKQECDRLGNPKLPEQEKGLHNALEDARHNKLMWKFLRDLESETSR